MKTTSRVTFALASVLCFAAAAASAGCHHAMRPDVAIANLQNPDPSVRQHAADSLRTPEGVPPESIQPLLAIASQEQNPQARGAMLITLGKSGSPLAKPLIDQAVMTSQDPDNRRWASRALKYWMITTGQLPAEYAFPPNWPYGQPGFPPPLAK